MSKSFFLSLLVLLLTLPASGRADDRPNVLMIWADDLRPEIASFGAAGMHTPNLDRLAARSVRFDRAYCNIPVCGASRASIMTGLRGTPTRFTDYLSRADEDAPQATTLNELFQKAGYASEGYGKIYHHDRDSANGWDRWERFSSWPGYFDPENIAIYEQNKAKDARLLGPPTEISPADDAELSDGKIARKAAERLRALAKEGEPFFLAAGFFKPHLPFVAPKKYWDLYPEDEIELPGNWAQRPDGVPSWAFAGFGELRVYDEIPQQGSVSVAQAKRLIRGYRAAVSFIDAQLGLLLDALDESGAADNTVVMLLGDHGFNLGEHGMWCKHCTFETSMRTPLLIAAPGTEGFAGGVGTDALAEFVDIYPTLAELAGVDVSGQPLAGVSLVPVLADPEASVREAAVGRWQSGETVRTDRYRYTEYLSDGGHRNAEMLYDHDADPAENVNVVADPALADTVADLRATLAEVRAADEAEELAAARAAAEKRAAAAGRAVDVRVEPRELLVSGTAEGALARDGVLQDKDGSLVIDLPAGGDGAADAGKPGGANYGTLTLALTEPVDLLNDPELPGDARVELTVRPIHEGNTPLLFVGLVDDGKQTFNYDTQLGAAVSRAGGADGPLTLTIDLDNTGWGPGPEKFRPPLRAVKLMSGFGTDVPLRVEVLGLRVVTGDPDADADAGAEPQ